MTKEQKAKQKEILDLIETQIGLKLKLCEFFSGIRPLGKESYFTVVLSDKVSESQQYIDLKRFSKKYKRIRIEPNGHKRVAIIF